MSIFSKKGDILDLTDLQRRGLLKKAEEIERQQSSPQTDSQGYVDFSSFAQPDTTVSAPFPGLPPPNSPSPDNSGVSTLGFLDTLAGSSQESSITPNPAYSTSSSPDMLEVQGLKNKIDDLEYKLERLMEKIARLESLD